MLKRKSPSAIVIHPVLNLGSSNLLRSPSSCLSEAIGLSESIGLTIVFSEVVNISKINPSTYIGKGKVEEIRDIICIKSADLVIMDCQLSAMQQRNLEKFFDCKVIDRTALILEIFGERASTREGVLQVELAHLSYQKSRLVRSWTHLERQRGGAGFLGGPGEKQIEMDRRIISERISKIKKDLEEVKRTRSLHRKARKKVPYSTIALVGYTNAGKSTLFNCLTDSSVLAKDQLFATLDPTMRHLCLPGGREVIISDTVGFISDLPTELVAAFRATLEEVVEADIILHIRDCCHKDREAQREDVYKILKSLGLEEKIENNLLEVLNKVDLLEAEEKEALITSLSRKDKVVSVSAKTGEGIKDLLYLIERKLGENKVDLSVKIPLEDGFTISWLYRRAEIVSRRDDDKVAFFHVRMDRAEVKRLEDLLKGKKKI